MYPPLFCLPTAELVNTARHRCRFLPPFSGSHVSVSPTSWTREKLAPITRLNQHVCTLSLQPCPRFVFPSPPCLASCLLSFKFKVLRVFRLMDGLRWFVYVQVFVYLLISNVKPRLLSSCACVRDGTCFFAAWAISLQLPVVSDLWDDCHADVLFHMYIWAAPLILFYFLFLLLLLCFSFFVVQPSNQISHWLIMRTTQEVHVLLSSWHTKTLPLTLYLRGCICVLMKSCT